jgi:hypothetical protein
MPQTLTKTSLAGVKADPPAEAAGVRKAPRYEVAVGGAPAGSDRYEAAEGCDQRS